jgi:hypothetical protein
MGSWSQTMDQSELKFNNCNKNLKGSLATLLLCGWYLLAFHGSSCELFFYWPLC